MESRVSTQTTSRKSPIPNPRPTATHATFCLDQDKNSAHLAIKSIRQTQCRWRVANPVSLGNHKKTGHGNPRIIAKIPAEALQPFVPIGTKGCWAVTGEYLRGEDGKRSSGRIFLEGRCVKIPCGTRSRSSHVTKGYCVKLLNRTLDRTPAHRLGIKAEASFIGMWAAVKKTARKPR